MVMVEVLVPHSTFDGVGGVTVFSVLFVCNGILLNHKKNEILQFAATWMNLENIMLHEVSRTEKDKYYMIPLICGI